MATDFKFYRILCSTPPELEAERVAFESAVAEFVERVSMPDAVLFAPASFLPAINAVRRKADIEYNIRTCEFFIQVFGEQWPDPVFQGFVEYALDCVADPSPVTRNACVLFRNHHAAGPELHELRAKLEAGGRCELRYFSGVEDLRGQFRELLPAWYATLKPGAA